MGSSQGRNCGFSASENGSVVRPTFWPFLEVVMSVDSVSRSRNLDARSGAGSLADRVLDIARSNLGFHEGAGNANPFSRSFGRPGEAWCADFVSYCFTKAGKSLNFANT